MKITALIVDDEPLAREKIRRLLRSETDVEIIGEAVSGAEAVEMIENQKPDLIFLDIQMPEMNGFEVLNAIKNGAAIPAVIFVTAYDKYAIKAFEVHALDYLLKPFDSERLQSALKRVREQLESKSHNGFDEKLMSLLSDLKAEKEYPQRLVLKTAGRVYFIKTSDIDWIEAAGNYVKLHIGKDAHLLRETMNKTEAKLDPEKFLRIHRSSLVNIDRIKELNPLFNGDYLVILQDKTELTLSRNYHDRLRALFEKFS
jgi:two-component system LytT family response regulator